MTYSNSLAVGRQRYSSADASTATRTWGRNQNAVSFAAKDRTLGPISNSIVLILLACLLFLLYLTQVTKSNTYSYKIDALNQQQTKLQEEHSDLQITSARLQSLERIQKSQAAKKLVSVAPNATVAD